MLNESLPLFIRLCLFRTNLCDWNLKQGIVLRLQAFLTLITEKGLPLEDTIDSFRIITVLFWAELSKSSEKSHNVNNNDKWITILNNLKKKGSVTLILIWPLITGWIMHRGWATKQQHILPYKGNQNGLSSGKTFKRIRNFKKIHYLCIFRF